MLSRQINLPKKQSFFLFGARQTGKTTLITNYLNQAKFLGFNLLDSEVYLRASRDPQYILWTVEQELQGISSHEELTVFIDEIQRIPELLNTVQLLLDRHQRVRVILTGSSTRKLKRIGTNLGGGRLLDFSLYPLTWKEIGGRVSLDQILRFGTLPPVINELLSSESSLEREQAAIRRLRSYLTVYLEQEVRNEGLVRSIGDFSRFLEIVAQNNGGLVNYSNIARESQVARKTVEGYYQILLDTLIGHSLEPYEPSVRKRVGQQPKFYLFDTGVVNAIPAMLTAEISQERRGMLFESMLICEAFRIRSYKESEAKLHFWRTRNGAEVDLIIEKHGKIIAGFEFKSGRTPHIKRKQVGDFLQIFPNVPLYVVTEELSQKIVDSAGNIFGSMISFESYLKLLTELL